GNVVFQVGASARRRIRQAEPAIHDRPVGVVQVRTQVLGGNERGVAGRHWTQRLAGGLDGPVRAGGVAGRAGAGASAPAGRLGSKKDAPSGIGLLWRSVRRQPPPSRRKTALSMAKLVSTTEGCRAIRRLRNTTQ